MSHDHEHGGCGGDADEHGLPENVLGYRDNLYHQIDRAHVVAFNANGQGQTVIKPWSERNDEESVRGLPIIPNARSALTKDDSTLNPMPMTSCMPRVIPLPGPCS
jgi:hypothetical protein